MENKKNWKTGKHEIIIDNFNMIPITKEEWKQFDEEIKKNFPKGILRMDNILHGSKNEIIMPFTPTFGKTYKEPNQQ